MKVYKIVFFIVFVLSVKQVQAKNFSVISPDGSIALLVRVDSVVTYSVQYKNNPLILSSEISMEITFGSIFGKQPTVKHAEIIEHRKEIVPAVKEKRAVISDNYNELVVNFISTAELQFRVYNDGVAYRILTHYKEDITVVTEKAGFSFQEGTQVVFAEVADRPDMDRFHTSFEEPYQTKPLDSVLNQNMAFSPVLLQKDTLPKVVITESDVFDYPGMFLKGMGKNKLEAEFAPFPEKEVISGSGFRLKTVAERALFIAQTKGTRAFPWRIMMIAPEDADLLVNDMVYRLAPEPEFSDFSWIKPGKSTEEWITALNLYGVDFEAGLNTATYKYYIDFARRFGFEYVMLDAGWSDINDLFSITPGMDMEEITDYAREKEVGLILWTQALTIEQQMKEALEQFKKWDIKIVMTDFIDRDDQKAVGFMHRFASECAKNKMMCMIHGAPPPKGFTRTWPNMMAREGVLGSEYNVWSVKANPDHDLLLPFIRMTAGPMDYEPGILQNVTREQTAKLGFEKVIAQGTRMHQIAMFVVYESPLQLFSGNLSDAMREPTLMDFLGKIPTVWDETLIIKAKLGKYIVEARRSGDEWFLAAMNSWEPVEFSVTLDFLEKGAFEMENAGDGINAGENPQDYKIARSMVNAGDEVTLKLAPGGGFVSRITKIEN